jgi:tetratricopeptide (TPR) repeat protein
MDSAVKYFKLAVRAASDPKYAKDRREAFLNVARVYHEAERYAEAAAAYHEYLAAYPNDVQGTASLAELYLRANRTDSALALYSRVLDHTDSATAEDLFAAARSLLSVIPTLPDTAVMDADCAKAAKKKSPALTARQVAARCAPAAADTMRKYHAVVDPEYRLVARTYEAGLIKNPYARDALYNLAGVSYTIGDTASVLGLAQRLYALDPMNRSTMAKLVGGWQLKGKKDSVLYYLTIADSLPVEVTISRFAPTEKGASLDGQMTNVRPKASPPVKITFDFLDAKGNVVATQSQDVPALEPNASQEFKLRVEQAGVVAWRYKRG